MAFSASTAVRGAIAYCLTVAKSATVAALKGTVIEWEGRMTNIPEQYMGWLLLSVESELRSQSRARSACQDAGLCGRVALTLRRSSFALRFTMKRSAVP